MDEEKVGQEEKEGEENNMSRISVEDRGKIDIKI